MSKRYPPEVREKALRLALEHLDEYPSVYAAAQVIGPMVDVHPESLRVWIMKAQKDPAATVRAGAVKGMSAVEQEELARLRRRTESSSRPTKYSNWRRLFSRGNSTRDTADRRIRRPVSPGV